MTVRPITATIQCRFSIPTESEFETLPWTFKDSLIFLALPTILWFVLPTRIDRLGRVNDDG